MPGTTGSTTLVCGAVDLADAPRAGAGTLWVALVTDRPRSARVGSSTKTARLSANESATSRMQARPIPLRSGIPLVVALKMTRFCNAGSSLVWQCARTTTASRPDARHPSVEPSNELTATGRHPTAAIASPAKARRVARSIDDTNSTSESRVAFKVTPTIGCLGRRRSTGSY